MQMLFKLVTVTIVLHSMLFGTQGIVNTLSFETKMQNWCFYIPYAETFSKF